MTWQNGRVKRSGEWSLQDDHSPDRIREREVLKDLKVLFSVRSEDILVQDFGKSPGIVLGTSKVELKQKPALSLLTAFVRENEAVFVFRQHTETSSRACLLLSSVASPGYQTQIFTSGHSTCPAVFLIFHPFLFSNLFTWRNLFSIIPWVTMSTNTGNTFSIFHKQLNLVTASTLRKAKLEPRLLVLTHASRSWIARTCGRDVQTGHPEYREWWRKWLNILCLSGPGGLISVFRWR